MIFLRFISPDYFTLILKSSNCNIYTDIPYAIVIPFNQLTRTKLPSKVYTIFQLKLYIKMSLILHLKLYVFLASNLPIKVYLNIYTNMYTFSDVTLPEEKILESAISVNNFFGITWQRPYPYFRSNFSPGWVYFPSIPLEDISIPSKM